jgi:hypothetical protein
LKDDDMTIAEITERLRALEQAVEELKSQVKRSAGMDRRWWIEDAGRFADDPVFNEIVRLGREYRESLRPGRRKPKKRGRS